MPTCCGNCSSRSSPLRYERIYALGHLRNSLPDRQRKRIKSLEREFYGMCRDLVAAVDGRRARSAEVAPVAFAMIGMVEHLISWFRPSGAMSVKQVATLYADLAVAMATAAAVASKAPDRRLFAAKPSFFPSSCVAMMIFWISLVPS